MRNEIALEVLPIEEGGFHIFIPARINGKKARFLVDTGASRSVVDKERISAFFSPGEAVLEKVEKLSAGLGTNSMESNTIILNLLSIGRSRLKNYHAVALDLTHVNQSYKLLELKEIDGVIGGDLLVGLNAVINYHERTMAIGKNH